MEDLLIADDKIKKLDIRQNTKLNILECNDNELIELDISNNPYLTILYCAGNKLSSLNLGSLTFDENEYDFDRNIREIPGPVFDLSNLPGDFDINRASNWQGGTINGTILTAKEDKVTYEYDCGGRYTTTFTLIPVDGIPIDQEHFPDTNFRNYVKEFCDDDRNLCFTTDEIDQINGIFVSGLDIQSLQGIEYFSNLFELDCSYNQLTSLDVSKNPKLEYINCEFNPLESLDVRQNVDLQKLRIRDTDISEIDLSNNGKLTSFYGNHTKLSSIDFSHNSQLKMALCRFSEIDSVDLSGCTALEVLQLGYNKLEALDISDCVSLTNLEFDTNNLSYIDVSPAKKLNQLIFNNNQIQKLDISSNPELTSLYCTNNKLVELDLSANSKLNTLFCGRNQLTSLQLDALNFYSGYSYDFEGNTYIIQDSMFDLSTLPGNFDINRASNWQGGIVDGMYLTPTSNEVTYEYDCGNGYSTTFTLLVVNRIETVADELTEVSPGLKYSTVQELKDDLVSKLTQINPKAANENTQFYDIKLLISFDNGETWIEAPDEYFLREGVNAIVPYPDGTDMSYSFYAVHMFTHTSELLGTVTGGIEYPTVTAEKDGIHMTLVGLSPVALSWTLLNKTDTDQHTDVEFHANVVWQVSSEHPKAKVRFYKNGVTGDHFLLETQKSTDFWTYDAYDLSANAEYYMMVEVPTGYYVEYANSNIGIQDRLYNGGTAFIRYMPPTGEIYKPLEYTALMLLSIVGIITLVTRRGTSC
ncbi:MAG: leucine-rich repeat domain-containing protein [Clostridia bacterium]|nr:leucine-rich repeat domain-containing protein [Clostridia bacterium]